MSATLLSAIERGVTEPSLRTLRSLAEVFGQSVSLLFDDPDAPAVHISVPGGTDNHPRPARPHPLRAPVVEQRKARNAARCPRAWRGFQRRAVVAPVVESVYVTAGVLTVEVAGRDYEVRAGQAVTIDSRQAHRYRNCSGDGVEFVLACAPPTP